MPFLVEKDDRSFEMTQNATPNLAVACPQVTAGPIVSQSVSSSSVNGVTTKSVSLLFAVRSSSGASGTARCVSHEASRAPRSLDLSVQLPDGSVVVVDAHGGGGRGAAGSTIDVEFTEVR